ncbi:MAG: 2OG-Fe(II) oxygenase [Arenimonas sp.]
MISTHVRDIAGELAERFQGAQPFRHVVIDGFLERQLATRLLAEFPAFDPALAVNENGKVGGKAVFERIRALGPSYGLLDQHIQGREFLDLVSTITGIPDLQYDPYYFGGGTHDNRNGQALDAHVDFNRHPVTHAHRRLNLIVYLNPEWEAQWGGILELHSDPRAADDQITGVLPLFNRAVIFETTEHSWHGFSPIKLPPDRENLARRSIALYFYTAERPAEEQADSHSTVYVDRPLPDRYATGLALTQADVDELQRLLQGRDQHIQRLYRDAQTLRAQLEQSLRTVGLVRGSLLFRSLAGVRRFARALFSRRPSP